eukprot:2915528-Pyramimonas_sp.AAC.1
MPGDRTHATRPKWATHLKQFLPRNIVVFSVGHPGKRASAEKAYRRTHILADCRVRISFQAASMHCVRGERRDLPRLLRHHFAVRRLNPFVFLVRRRVRVRDWL